MTSDSEPGLIDRVRFAAYKRLLRAKVEAAMVKHAALDRGLETTGGVPDDVWTASDFREHYEAQYRRKLIHYQTKRGWR